MTPTMNLQATQSDYQILCGYVNTTNLVQIIRIANIPGWYFERVIFPGQRLFFEAQPEAELEVYTSHNTRADDVKKPANFVVEQVLSLLELKKTGAFFTPSLSVFLVNEGSV